MHFHLGSPLNNWLNKSCIFLIGLVVGAYLVCLLKQMQRKQTPGVLKQTQCEQNPGVLVKTQQTQSEKTQATQDISTLILQKQHLSHQDSGGCPRLSRSQL